jgi:hypothetical protein
MNFGNKKSLPDFRVRKALNLLYVLAKDSIHSGHALRADDVIHNE